MSRCVWWRSKLLFLLFCLLSGALTGVFAAGILKSDRQEYTSRWKLDAPIIYDSQMKSKLESGDWQNMHFLFWRREKAVIENREFSRAREIKAYGIVGDTSVIFPGSNGVHFGEERYCVLSYDVAIELFGSREVTGKKVLLDGRQYWVSGVFTQKKGSCLYGLSPGDGKKVFHAACGARSRMELFQNKQMLMAGF